MMRYTLEYEVQASQPRLVTRTACWPDIGNVYTFVLSHLLFRLRDFWLGHPGRLELTAHRQHIQVFYRTGQLKTNNWSWIDGRSESITIDATWFSGSWSSSFTVLNARQHPSFGHSLALPFQMSVVWSLCRSVLSNLKASCHGHCPTSSAEKFWTWAFWLLRRIGSSAS